MEKNSLQEVLRHYGNWPALSIKQPWAWLILHANKNIENRTWQTDFRGKFYIHSGQKFDMNGYEDILDYRSIYLSPRLVVPEPEQFPRGGIVGIVEMVDCVEKAESIWAEHWPGTWNFVLESPKELEFIPCRGRLGFFNLI